MDPTHTNTVPQAGSRRGRRAAWLAIALVVVIVAVLGWAYRDDVWGWIVGYRVWRMEEGVGGAFDVNRYGQAAVYREIADPGSEVGSRREAGRWSAALGQFEDLGLGGETDEETAVEAINNHGHLAAYEAQYGANPSGSVVLWRGAAEAIWINAPENLVLFAHDVNDCGQVVGHSRVSPHAKTPPDAAGEQAFLWTENDGFIDIHSKMESWSSFAVAVNNHGSIVGTEVDRQGRMRPFLFEKGKVSILLGDDSDSPDAAAVDINDQGEVLINCMPDTACGSFVWSLDSGLQPVPPPPGCTRVVLYAIDSTGRILLSGESGDEMRYYVRSGDELLRLPDVAEHGRTTYWSLADRGWLAGSTWEELGDGTRVTRGFLLRLYR